MTSSQRSVADRPLLGGPRSRAPRWLRAVIALGALAAGLFSAALLLSDRAPGVLRTVLGPRIERLWNRVDLAGRPAELAGEAASQPDAVVHVVLWAVVTVLAVLTLWSWRATPFVVVAVAASSLVIELGQGVWSDTRAVERSDMAANLLGTGIGAAVAIAVMGLWSALGSLTSRSTEI
ncbi:hypothetical protein BDK89_2022 [Ilumatobacter fluminis]|uniref:VanZ like protein n=1 Tax=Ilumatobacter fluminis TaxID=467091 RepID=A0A4R7HYW9_9ACTN|nr:hypothetical protein [Ilumatobacter fluminis]TDT16432.1 hypothetical protein BDK89_2022 [Ilumatobacter fluminis]